MNSPSLAPRPRLASRRGSVLVVAMIFSIVIAISLASFLRISTSASQLSYRTYYQGVAMNIAETGLEQAMWEVNNDAGTWTDWVWGSATGDSFRRSFDFGKVEGGATAVVKVYAKEKTGSSPAWILARAIVSPPRGNPIEKWVKVTLDRKSRLRVGGLGKEGIVANGNNVLMGSWNSDPDNDPSTSFIPFSVSVMKDNMSLATTEFDASINSGNADINGKAAVGGNSTDAINVGSQGYIGPFGTAAGTKDPNSVSTNFSTDLEIISAPTATYTTLGSVGSALTLPRGGDVPQDGVYYYTASQINLNGAALSITPGAKVVINVPKGLGDAITIGGNGGAIKVGGTLVTNTSTGETTYTAGALEIYTDGNIKISGQGTAINSVETQTYTPASTGTKTVVTKTTISDVTNEYGKGKYKDDVIGWNYKKTIVTETSINSGSPTITTTTTYFTDLIEAGFTTKPVAGTTTDSQTYPANTPEVIADTGTLVGQPINLQIFGTRSDADRKTYGPQDFQISGNGSLSAVVYAPNASISAKGGGNSGFMYGSLVGNTLTFTGNDCFYYDESLGNEDKGSRLGIEDWDELVSNTDRATISNVSSKTYAELMNF